MLKVFNKVPAYVYLAGLVGATATYIFYQPTKSSIPNSKRKKRALLNGMSNGFKN
jgi:hypothetical protein